MAVQCQVPCKETVGAVSPSLECWQSNRQTQLQEVKFYLIYWSFACDQARNDSSPVFVSAYSVSRGVLTPATRPWRWSQRCRPIPALQRWDNGTGVFVWVGAFMTGLTYLSPDHRNSNLYSKLINLPPHTSAICVVTFLCRIHNKKESSKISRSTSSSCSFSVPGDDTHLVSCLQEKSLVLCL